MSDLTHQRDKRRVAHKYLTTTDKSRDQLSLLLFDIFAEWMLVVPILEVIHRDIGLLTRADEHR